MITDENKYEVIDAYLLGLLNGDDRREVEQKMAEEPNFYTEVVLQKALLTELDQQETNDTNRLIDRLLAEEAQPIAQPDTEPDSDMPVIPIGQNPQKRWGLRDWRVAAGLILTLGLGWFGYRVVAPPTVTANIPHQQRVLGGFGADSLINASPLSVTFVQKLFGSPEYENGSSGLRMYMTSPPSDWNQWLLTDDDKTGGYRLRTPNGTVYTILPNTAGERKMLTK